MKLLADANVEAAIVHWLRSLGHDVAWTADMPPSIPDDELVRLANEEGRVMITYDRDFGELVYLRGEVAQGIVLLRFDAALQVERLAKLQRHWPTVEEQAPGHFLVVSERSVRVRTMP